MRTLEGSGHIKTPDWHEHGDFVVPFAFIDWFSAAQDLPAFDIMLEAKARDVALLKLREDLARFAPELVGRFA
jgi:UV DNA damage endonuclease